MIDILQIHEDMDEFMPKIGFSRSKNKKWWHIPSKYRTGFRIRVKGHSLMIQADDTGEFHFTGTIQSSDDVKVILRCLGIGNQKQR